jgi:nitrogen-specific signal transduction histidine kinase
MGGTIDVDSKPGRTVFSLKLPTPEEEKPDGKRSQKFPRGT